MTTFVSPRASWRVLVVSTPDEARQVHATLASSAVEITWADAGAPLPAERGDVVLVVGVAIETHAAALADTAWIAQGAIDAMDRAFALGAADFVAPGDARLRHALAREALRSRHRAAAKGHAAQLERTSATALASFQKRAMQMEVIRQQNDELQRLAADLASANAVAEQRSEELGVAVRVRTEFLANFSHEIRTPLNAILGYCDLVLREEGERLTPSARRDLNVVKQNARLLLELITDILDLSRIEAGHMQIVVEATELFEIVSECKATVAPLLSDKPVEVQVRIAANASELCTDSLKLRQVILNLLSNAAKFTDAGVITVSASMQSRDLVLEVIDTGAGIPSEQLEIVFEKFRQVEGGTTRRVGGTGLGLAIVREVCSLLGGSVSVASTLGRGSHFTVRLPNVAPPRGTIAPSRPPPGRLQRPQHAALRRVLYVEDAPLNRDLMRRMLRDQYELFEAEDGESGLARVAELMPDVVLMDLSLPRVDGWEATRRIKADPRLRHIPVIAVSAHSGVDERRRAKEAGCISYVTKPVDRKLLCEIIEQMLHSALNS